jgi:hypothetical protein
MKTNHYMKAPQLLGFDPLSNQYTVFLLDALRDYLDWLYPGDPMTQMYAYKNKAMRTWWVSWCTIRDERFVREIEELMGYNLDADLVADVWNETHEWCSVEVAADGEVMELCTLPPVFVTTQINDELQAVDTAIKDLLKSINQN